ncbi:MAG: DUF4392 domain-containing protein, partial [Fretibacterium sp.]|nr:DUF4392 domain-containing protein [Fretibacterium sp.]
VTGFFIRSASATETDGPPGAAVLGRALERMGKRVELWTDERNFGPLVACSASIGGPEVHLAEGSESTESELLVFVERPGRAPDGCYYDMKGEDVASVVAPLDFLVEKALAEGRHVLGVGDGGNEVGMGLLRDELTRLLPNYASFLSCVSSTVCLPVDVSNWGAYALAAALSVPFGSWQGLEPEEERTMLEALIASGAVDGVSKRKELSVDGLALEQLEGVAFQIKEWYFNQSVGSQ